jgi:SAM-dependent methyltransferase
VESQALATHALIDELQRRLQAVEARAEAAALAEQRQRHQVAALTDAQRVAEDALRYAQERQGDHLREIARQLPALQELRAAADAEPHMEGEPFTRFAAPAAGRVLGYRGGGTETTAAYHDFEDVFRGSEALIRERQRRYLPLLADHAPVFDLGCGRGELLDLLREAGVAARGVDLDPELVAYCQGKGHEDVQAGDGVALLEAVEPGTVGAICSMQVVEHLDAPALDRLLAAAHRALVPGGRLILETVNPHSPWALKAFWVDLTHEQPIFPEVLLQLARQAGFREAYAFIPQGEGDWDADRTRFGEYAVVATR